MARSRCTALLAGVGAVAMTLPAVGAQQTDLKVSVPAITAAQVAAVATAQDHDRWNNEFWQKTVRWSGVVVVPPASDRIMFERLYVGSQLLQLDLKEVVCELPVPDASIFKKGSTVTFIGTLGGWWVDHDRKVRVRFSQVRFETTAK